MYRLEDDTKDGSKDAGLADVFSDEEDASIEGGDHSTEHQQARDFFPQVKALNT